MHRPVPLLVLIVALLLPGAPAALAAGAPSGGGKEAPASASAASAPAAAGPSARPKGTRARLAPASKPKGHEKAQPKTAQEEKARAARAPEVPARSVGHPNDGRLEGGIRLNTALEEIRVVPTYAREDVRWGLPSLVRMIERAAREVAKRHPGSVLEVGDLSRRGGGEIAGHGSHESGRDADIGFYAVDDKGRQVQSRTFLRFGPGLRATQAKGARFDVVRNWLLVQHLLTDPRARVSHIFIAEPLRQALLVEAKRRGVSRALLTRAQLAMMQPTGAEPHDDHMHVRISCPRAEDGRCMELARNAPSKHKRAKDVAGAGKAGKSAARKAAARRPARATPTTHPARATRAAHAVTPAAPGRAAAPRRAEQTASSGRTRRTTRTTASVEDDAPAAARGAAQVPMVLDAIDLAILAPLRARRRAAEPAESAEPTSAEAEAEADGAEVRDALDDSGAPKITD